MTGIKSSPRNSSDSPADSDVMIRGVAERMSDLNIDIKVFCSVETSRLEAFAALLRELSSVVGSDALASLTTVFVVDGDQLPATVNALIEAVGGSGSYTPSPDHLPEGVAVPLESEGTLVSAIVVSRALVEPLSSEHNHYFETVSTVLEELLHVCVYGAAWQRRGYVQHRRSELLACEADLLTIASQMCDEYVVIRRKARLMATLPLVEVEGGAGFSTAELAYGGSIIDTFMKGASEIRSTLRDASRGLLPASDSWSKLAGLLYRAVLEPLARNAAYCDAASQVPTVDESHYADPLYSLVHRHWPGIQDRLRRVFTSDLTETEIVLAELLETLRTLVSELGVIYRRTDQGSCWVEFHAG